MGAEDLGRSGAALLIGVGDYLHSDRVGRLRYAERDAQALADVLTEPGVCGFPPDRVLLLTGAEAGRDEIVGRLSKWLSEVARGVDIVFLYFAGHGAVQRVGLREEGFLLPFDADPDDLLTRGVAMSDLARWIEGIEAAAVVVCLDCCHAGRVLTRQATAAPGEARDVKLRPAMLQGLAGKGRYLIASCDEGQVSIEVETHGHGLFTHHLLRGLQGEADRDGDGRVGVAELFEFVAEAVEADARRLGFAQKPWNHSTGTGGVYLSRPRGPKGPSNRPGASDGDGPEQIDSIRDAERLLAEGPEDRLVLALDRLGRLDDPTAIPCLFRGLSHPSRAVRERARKALRALGWERTTAAVETLARRADAERIGPILDGLAAFESHRDVVALLDRLVALLRGDLRNRAILLWERKRLALDLEDVAEVFRAVGSPYQLQKALGQGLFTAAYLARDEQTDLDVVIRVLRPEFAAQPPLRARFLDLARSSTRLVHQNLVLTREVRTLPDRKIDYVVRDYVDGVTLQRMFESGKVFTPAQILTILRQVLQALTPLHEAGLPHGGIKPSNIFVRGDDRVILGDLALPSQGVHLALDRLSYDYRYAAPELFRGGTKPEPSADFYALGCLGYELACGAPPFVSDNPFELATMHDREPVTAPRERGSRLGPGDDFLMRLLAKAPRDRFTSIEQVLSAIEKLARPAKPRSEKKPRAPAPPPRQAAEGSSPGSWRARPKKPREAQTWGGPVPQVPAHPEDAPPLVGEASLIRYDEAQSIISFDPNSMLLSPEGMPSQGLIHCPDDIDRIDRVKESTALPTTTGTSSGEDKFQPGQVIFDRYQVERLLGRGGMGTVWLVRHLQLDTPRALKLIHSRVAADPKIRERLRREARIMARLDHPNAVRVFDVWLNEEATYIEMEYVSGSDLNRLLRPGIAMPIEWSVRLVLKLCGVLQAAHEASIIHRDLKPSNILMMNDDFPKISDFGLAKLHGEETDEGSTTQTGTIIGTPAYMAPEQALGQVERIGPATDIYSLGVIFYETLTGRRPFQGGLQALLFQHLQKDPDPPSLYEPELPRELDAIVLKCLNKRPEARYPSAVALTEDLERFLATSRTEVHTTDFGPYLAEDLERFQRANPIPPEAPNEGRVPSDPAPVPTASPLRRAGFWRRFLPF